MSTKIEKRRELVNTCIIIVIIITNWFIGVITVIHVHIANIVIIVVFTFAPYAGCVVMVTVVDAPPLKLAVLEPALASVAIDVIHPNLNTWCFGTIIR